MEGLKEVSELIGAQGHRQPLTESGTRVTTIEDSS